MVKLAVTCATELPKAVFYADKQGGWADGRLGQAYDLIVAVRGAHWGQTDVAILLRQLEDQIDSADRQLAEVQS